MEMADVKVTVRENLIETVYADALQNNDYLRSIVEQWVDSHNYEDSLFLASGDESDWPHIFDVNPRTGKNWED